MPERNLTRETATPFSKGSYWVRLRLLNVNTEDELEGLVDRIFDHVSKDFAGNATSMLGLLEILEEQEMVGDENARTVAERKFTTTIWGATAELTLGIDIDGEVPAELFISNLAISVVPAFAAASASILTAKTHKELRHKHGVPSFADLFGDPFAG